MIPDTVASLHCFDKIINGHKALCIFVGAAQVFDFSGKSVEQFRGSFKLWVPRYYDFDRDARVDLAGQDIGRQSVPSEPPTVRLGMPGERKRVAIHLYLCRRPVSR